MAKINAAKVKAGNVELVCASHGAGPALVLIPGFGTGAWLWFKQVDALAAHFRVVVFDPRGVSGSDCPDEAFTTRTLADDIACLLSSLGIARAHILGASFGGFVAQEFALAYPELTSRLVLACTSFGGPKHVAPSFEVLEAMASTEDLNTDGRVRRNLLLSFSQKYLTEHADDVEEIIRLRAANPIPHSAYLRQLRAAIAFNVESRVHEINMPTLVISGDRDVIVPVENSRNLAAGVRGSKLRIIEGGSHQFFIENADEFNLAVIEFLELAPAQSA